MSGITDLGTLLAAIRPELHEAEMVFCSFATAEVIDELVLSAAGFFKEREGITLIVARADAERHGVSFCTVMKVITLTVHSGLEAVGLTAAVTSRLARHGISANVVAAFTTITFLSLCQTQSGRSGSFRPCKRRHWRPRRPCRFCQSCRRIGGESER